MNSYSSALLASMTAAAANGGGASPASLGSMNSMAAALANGVGGGIRRTEVQGLPKGWIREETPRFDAASFLNGLGSGSPAAIAAAAAAAASAKPDVVYYSPKGHRVRTKAEMSRLLGDAYDLTAFDFQTGKINPLLLSSLGAASAAQLAAAAAAMGGAPGGGGRTSSASVSRSSVGNGQSSRKQSSTNHVSSRNGPTSQVRALCNYQ